MISLIAIAHQLHDEYDHAEQLNDVLAAVTSYANDLGVATGVQSGGVAPYAEVSNRTAASIRQAYRVAERLPRG